MTVTLGKVYLTNTSNEMDMETVTKRGYFVSAAGFNGSRHYSEDFTDYLDALAAFDQYKAVLSFISGGGKVYIYAYRYGDIELVKEDWCL